MNREEHLMTIAMEECCEVAHRLAKVQRFGMHQVQLPTEGTPGQNAEGLTNKERIIQEFHDLRATLGMLGIDAWDNSDAARQSENRKVQRVEKYLALSRSFGTLKG